MVVETVSTAVETTRRERATSRIKPGVSLEKGRGTETLRDKAEERGPKKNRLREGEGKERRGRRKRKGKDWRDKNEEAEGRVKKRGRLVS